MDILNYKFDRGRFMKHLPKYYAFLDSYFFKVHDDPTVRQNVDELNFTYYIDFSGRKPLLYPAMTRPEKVKGWSEAKREARFCER